MLAYGSASPWRIGRVVRRRMWTIVIATAIVTGGALLASFSAATEYRATATLLVGSANVVSGLLERQEPMRPTTAARLVRTRDIAKRAADTLEVSTSERELLDNVAVEADAESGVVVITGVADEPEAAITLANAFATAFVAEREELGDERIRAVVRALQRRLDSLPAGSGERNAVAVQLAELRSLQALPSADVRVIEPAAEAEETRPGPVRYGALGLALGLVLGLGLAFFREAVDPRIKTIEELGRTVAAPHLASFGDSTFRRAVGRRSRATAPALRAAERQADPFETLRTALFLFGGDEVKTVLVTSPSDAGEGKTLIASGLAVSLARTGMRVCVVDADLGRPAIGRAFGLDPSETGIGDIVAAEASLASAVHRVDLGDGAADGGRGQTNGELMVVPAGARAGRTLVGARLDSVLDQLERDFDVVVVVGAPILKAGGSLGLARRAGVLLVVRFFATRRDAAARAVSLVERLGGSVLGVTATRVAAAELREEGYGPWPVP